MVYSFIIWLFVLFRWLLLVFGVCLVCFIAVCALLCVVWFVGLWLLTCMFVGILGLLVYYWFLCIVNYYLLILLCYWLWLLRLVVYCLCLVAAVNLLFVLTLACFVQFSYGWFLWWIVCVVIVLRCSLCFSYLRVFLLAVLRV